MQRSCWNCKMRYSLVQKYKDIYSPDKTDLQVLGIFSFSYVFWNILFVGWRNDHLSFLLFLVLCMVLSPLTRKVFYAFCFFTLFWIIYDSMRIYPNYLFSAVNIENLYLTEKSWFGISEGDMILTPNEYFELHQNSILDFLSGIFYLTWVPVPLALGLYFFFTDKKMLLRFSAAYLFTNLIGFCIYYVYPAAPPWYFDKFGNVELLNTMGDAAGLIRFDNLIGYPLFSNMYTRNANVFAAMPSLHAAYPILALFYAMKARLNRVAILIFIDVAGIWFAAVYSFHHYVLDIIAGFVCALTAIFIFESLLMQTRLRNWLESYANFIDRKDLSVPLSKA